jgi:hypothetical protein
MQLALNSHLTASPQHIYSHTDKSSDTDTQITYARTVADTHTYLTDHHHALPYALLDISRGGQGPGTTRERCGHGITHSVQTDGQVCSL